MITRRQQPALKQKLADQPAVVLTGPRQSGKTTLAHEVISEHGGIYLDLEAPSDRSKLSDPELFFKANPNQLIVLDEVQRQPQLFEVLRGVIDQGRRAGHSQQKFLLLGSASIDLVAGVSESLAGRIAMLELSPIDVLEATASSKQPHQLWLRGGFPLSLLADNDAQSFSWRSDFVSTYLERDIKEHAPRIPAETLRRLWTMLAHSQGGQLNQSSLAQGLGISGQTVARYIDLLVDLLLVRRLQPLQINVGKRLTKSPKVYLRDSGIVHSLLGISDFNSLLGHPVVGGSWEGFVIENLIGVAGTGVTASFYRTAAGAEVDLVLDLQSGQRLAIEIKRTSTPSISKGLRHALSDLNPDQTFVVCETEADFPLSEQVTAVSLSSMTEHLQSYSTLNAQRF